MYHNSAGRSAVDAVHHATQLYTLAEGGPIDVLAQFFEFVLQVRCSLASMWLLGLVSFRWATALTRRHNCALSLLLLLADSGRGPGVG